MFRGCSYLSPVANSPRARLHLPPQIKLAHSFYNCDYKAYLHAMVDLEHVLKQDRYLAPHTAFWMRELHILAYKQFLDACKWGSVHR